MQVTVGESASSLPHRRNRGVRLGARAILARSHWRLGLADRLESMEVTLFPDLENKLAQAVDRGGVSAQVLTREATEQAVGYDDWFIREVEAGLAQIEAGRLLTHDAVGARLERKPSEHQSRR